MTSEASPAGWASISALSCLKGRDKSTISRRVRRLEEAGLLRARRGPKGEKLVNIEAFDRLVESHGDAQQEMNGMRASADTDLVLSQEQAKRAAADAEMKRMDLEERRGRILSADHAERFVDTCSANAQTVLWRLPGLVEEIIAIGTKEGVPAARTFVKGHVRAAIAEVGAMVRMIADPRREKPDAALTIEEFEVSPASADTLSRGNTALPREAPTLADLGVKPQEAPHADG